MAWEISHTQDAWWNVEQRLAFKKWVTPMRRALTLDDVAVWWDNEQDQRPELVVIKHADAKYRKFSHQQLVEETMNRIRDHRLCTNGGHEFFMDRGGWYTVSCADLTESQLIKLPYWSI